MKVPKWVVTIGICAACVLVVLGTRAILSGGGVLSATKAIPARAEGNPSAAVRIIEHMDYQCGACQAAAFMLREYLRKYPDRMYLEVKLHPLQVHAHGKTSAVYAECASQQKKFWEFHYLLFERQPQWSGLGDVREAFHEIARVRGLDIAALDACVQESDTWQKVALEGAAGSSLGVRSTPTFFVNGKMVVGTVELIKELDIYFPNEKKPEAKP